MIRATTGGVMKTYRRNLMNSFIGKNNAMNTVLTQRTFNSYAEDPASAAKAFRLRKSRMTVSAQHDVCSDTLKKYQTAFTCLDTIDKLIDTENGTQMSTLKSTTLEMLNDPKGDARTQLAEVLDVLGETIVQNLNQKYGDNFIFAGADGQNVPFEVKDSTLYYRGVPVDAAEPKVLTDENGALLKLGNDYVLAETPTLTQDERDAAVTDGEDPADFTSFDTKDDDGNTVTMYYRTANAKTMTEEEYNTAKTNAEKMDYLMNKEKKYVDIGLGFQENENSQLIASSAFDAALKGPSFIGYGLDADGDPKNIYSLVQRMKEVANSVPEGGEWSEATWNEFDRLVGKLEIASSEYKTAFTNMSASTTKLENNEALLKENFYNLKEQYSAIEDVDMVEAISSYLWAEYAYNAALKVGNSVLSQSLMDYIS